MFQTRVTYETDEPGALVHASVTDTPVSGPPVEADICPYCLNRLEIVSLKFRWRGAAMIMSCPNCAITSVADCRAAKSVAHAQPKKLREIDRSFWQAMTDTGDKLNSRVRHILAALFAAAIVAAVLRHVLHVYGGLPREEIRVDALISLAAFAIAMIFLRRKRRD